MTLRCSTISIFGLLITVVVGSDSNSWHKYGIGRITRVYSDAESNKQFIAASEKGILARLHVSNLTTVWRTPPVHTNDVFESILTVDDKVVLTIVQSGSGGLRYVRVYSLKNGTIFWDAPACGLVGSVNVMQQDEKIARYVAIRECDDGTGVRSYFDVLSGVNVTANVEGLQKSAVGWYDYDQGSGKKMKDGSLRWRNFMNDADERVELYSHWDAKFVVGDVVRHEGMAHAVDSRFVAANKDERNRLDTVVVLSEFGTLFAYNVIDGELVWVHELKDKSKSDVCSFVKNGIAPNSIIVFCTNNSNGDTRVIVVSVEHGQNLHYEKVRRFKAVHGYSHERCCSSDSACLVLVNELGERRLLTTCDKEYMKKNGMSSDNALHVYARLGGNSVMGYTGEKNPTWRFELPAGHNIVGLALKRTSNVVSRRARLSRVRVTEDRKLLRKHIDSATTLVLGQHETTEDGNLMAIVINGNSGAVMKALNHVNASAPITAVATDNWFVYSYWNTYLLQQELHVIDMYEPKDDVSFIVRKALAFVNEHLPHIPTIGEMHSNIEGTCDVSGTCDGVRQRKTPEMIHTSFLLSHQVKILEHSETEAGITESSVILGLGNGQVVSLSRLAVDARRPLNGGYASAESLMPYYPYISFIASESAGQFVTQDKYLAGLRGVGVAPVWRRESSCHVVAFGVDMYYRMLQPAGSFDMLPNDFRFNTVLGSVACILIAAMYSRNAVEGKILREAWYNS